MEIDDIIGFVFLFLIVVVPVLGVTARLALKPIVDALIRLRENFAPNPGGVLVERRVLELEEELRQVRAEVRRLAEAEAFHRELLAPGVESPHA